MSATWRRRRLTIRIAKTDAGGSGTGCKRSCHAALLKKLASLGADASVVANLKRAPDGKAEALFFDSVVKGATLTEGLQKSLAEAIAKLPIAKVMTYPTLPVQDGIP